MVCFRSCQELVAELGPEPGPRVPSPVSGVGAAEGGQGGDRGKAPWAWAAGPRLAGPLGRLLYVLFWGSATLCPHPASPNPGLLWGCGFSFQEEICLLCSQFPPPSRKHPHPPTPTHRTPPNAAAQIAPTFRSYVTELSGAPATPALLRHAR